MLDMRPTCERCGTTLPADRDSARICSYECTFCETCATEMSDTCPNCSGVLRIRPTRV